MGKGKGVRKEYKGSMSEESKWQTGLEGAAGGAHGAFQVTERVWIFSQVPWEALGGFYREEWLI